MTLEKEKISLADDQVRHQKRLDIWTGKNVNSQRTKGHKITWKMNHKQGKNYTN